MKCREDTGSTKLDQLELGWKQMPNTVAYPDLALEKFIAIDSSEDPTAIIRLLKK